MLFRIAGHSVVERRLGHFCRRTVDEQPAVEIVDLRFQLDGVRIAVVFGHEYAFVLGFVAAQHEQVRDAEKLKVEQDIFGLLACEAAAQDVGDDGDVILVLDGCCHGHRPRTPAQAAALEKAAAQVLVDVFAAMGGDVDVFRVKLAEGVDGLIERVNAFSFYRGKNLEGKGRLVGACNQINNFHALSLVFYVH